MDLKNVKAITIPQGSVKKIEDSNGKIIWGSQAAFPYRRLEYLHFSGTEYLQLGSYKPQKSFHFVDIKIPTNTSNWQFILGCAHTVSGTFYRLFWQTAQRGVGQYRLKADSTDAWSTDTYGNNLIELRMRIYNTNNTTGEFWFAVQEADNVPMTGEPVSPQDSRYGNQLYGKKINSTNYAVNFNNWTSPICIGGYMSNGVVGSPEARPIMNLYRYYIRSEGDASNIVHCMFPAQRKSDGVCGLYNVKNGIFFPMTGTNITDAAAGPVIDEYWNLQA